MSKDNNRSDELRFDAPEKATDTVESEFVFKGDASGAAETAASELKDDVTEEAVKIKEDAEDIVYDAEKAQEGHEEAEEETEAAEETPKKREKRAGEGKKSRSPSFVKIVGVLTLICSVVALMLSAVNLLTRDAIAENTEREKLDAITRIFPDADDAVRYDEAAGDHEIYLAVKDSDLIGYCVGVAPKGYGGDIEMMVGVGADGKVSGIEIVTMSETPGVGSRVKSDPSFLPQFAGKSAPFVIGENCDAVSGASISSKAVIAGVNEALSVPIDLEAAAKFAGVKFSRETDESDSAESETTAPVTEASETVPEPETTAPESEDVAAIDPTMVGGYDNGEYYPSDTVYVEEEDTGYYMEHETTDTESETEAQTDENGNPVDTDEDDEDTEEGDE